jgi:hypothetical protein
MHQNTTLISLAFLLMFSVTGLTKDLSTDIGRIEASNLLLRRQLEHHFEAWRFTVLYDEVAVRAPIGHTWGTKNWDKSAYYVALFVLVAESLAFEKDPHVYVGKYAHVIFVDDNFTESGEAVVKREDFTDLNQLYEAFRVAGKEKFAKQPNN